MQETNPAAIPVASSPEQQLAALRAKYRRKMILYNLSTLCTVAFLFVPGFQTRFFTQMSGPVPTWVLILLLTMSPFFGWLVIIGTLVALGSFHYLQTWPRGRLAPFWIALLYTMLYVWIVPILSLYSLLSNPGDDQFRLLPGYYGFAISMTAWFSAIMMKPHDKPAPPFRGFPVSPDRPVP